jgi:hypothetical protein
MVEISKCKEPCFANLHSGCKVLTVECERESCPFYKPADCTDWIRREEGGKVWLIAPEEYYAETAERW